MKACFLLALSNLCGLLSLLSAAAAPIALSAEDQDSLPFSEIGARVTADSSGENLRIEPRPDGAQLWTGFQKLEGIVTEEGLQIMSSDGAPGALRLRSGWLGREAGSDRELADQGEVFVSEKLVTYSRPLVSEEYSVSANGIRQDFFLFERPEGDGRLRVGLLLSGAIAEDSPDGVRLKLEDSGRELLYNRLHVTDGSGRELAASMSATSSDRIDIWVDDSEAVYPIRIDPTFTDADWVGLDSAIPGANGSVYAVVADGGGNIYMGGEFTIAGNVFASNVVKWDGSSWSALGEGVDGTVRALAIDGSDLYVGGDFTSADGVAASNIAKWDGSQWSALGSGVDHSVRALELSGSDLIAGGLFANAGGLLVNSLAKWDGNSWSSFGSGVETTQGDGQVVQGYVFTIKAVGSDLYVGGSLTAIDGVAANRIAKWDGSAWSALGSGTNGSVSAIEELDGDIYAGGQFTQAGDISSPKLAKWDGNSWSAVGSVPFTFQHEVHSLLANGSDLYVAGDFNVSGASDIRKWDGTQWTDLNIGISTFGAGVRALAISDGALYAGGDRINGAGALDRNGAFYYATAYNIVKWTGFEWSGVGQGFNGAVTCMAVKGSELYVGGSFRDIDETNFDFIAKWDGNQWSSVGGGLGGPPSAMEFIGDDLYVAGSFTTAGGIAANRIAKWDGTTWSGLGSGLNNYVYALKAVGSDLYVGGSFTTAGGVSANRVAKWDGFNWSSLGDGIASTSGRVWALEAIGTDLYVGGSFSSLPGTLAQYIAKWDGSDWSALGVGPSPDGSQMGPTGAVRALEAIGTDLYVGGEFNQIGLPTQYVNTPRKVVKWNGSQWSTLSQGVLWGRGGAPSSDVVKSLLAIGDTLYAGGLLDGTFYASGVNNIAQWDGASWSAIGSGIQKGSSRIDAVSTVESFGLLGTDLYVGGDFLTAGTTVSPFIARAIPAGELGVFDGGSPLIDNTSIVNVGGAQTGGSSVSKTITLRNVSLSNLTGIAVTLDASADFALDTSATADVLGAGESTTFDIVLTPSETGVLATGDVSIVSSDPNNSLFEFQVTGRGLFPPPTVVGFTQSIPLIGTNSFTIQGTNFEDAVPGENTVTFLPTGSGTVTAATTTSLTVTGVSGLSGGPLSVTVTTFGQSNPSPVQIATIFPRPTVDENLTRIRIDSDTLIIGGSNFDYLVPANNIVQFSTPGTSGTVTAATPTSLTVTGITGLVAGELPARVVTLGQNSSSIPVVATVLAPPTVTTSANNLASDASSITIYGSFFDSLVPGNNVVTFSPSGFGTVSAATDGSLTVSGISGLAAGPLNAVVTTLGQGSGAPIQIGTVLDPPVVTENTSSYPISARTDLIITGSNFDEQTIINNTVTFSPSGTGTITAATSDSLTISGLNGLVEGPLSAVVTTLGQSSGQPVQVANVTPVPPEVTENLADLPANATTLVIEGNFFDSSDPSNNVVQFTQSSSDGSNVTQFTAQVSEATSTSLTITGLGGLRGGPLNVVVVTDGRAGASQIVATVIPIVTLDTTEVLSSIDSLTINGFGFDPDSTFNSVAFSPSGEGSITESSGTSITVTGIKGLVGGPLSAVLTVNNVDSGSPVQVATVLPVRDVAIIGLQYDGSRQFSWVPLNNLEAGDQIYFTDTGYYDSIGGFNDNGNTSEFLLRYTVPAEGLCVGVVQQVVAGAEGPHYEFIQGTNLGEDSASIFIDPNGEQIHAFRSTDDPALGTSFTTSNLTPLFAVNGASTSWTNTTVTTDDNQTNLHPAFTDGVDAVAVGFGPTAEEEWDNVWYQGTTEGTPADLLAEISNPANWTGSDSTPPDNSNNGVEFFTVTGLSHPEIAVFEGSGVNGIERSDNVGIFDFGYVEVGDSITQTFTIRNVCSAELNGISVSSTNPAEFTVDAASTATSLAPGATTTFTVTFSIPVEGSTGGLVEILSSDADESIFEIPVVGAGAFRPVVTANPADLNSDATTLLIEGGNFDTANPGNNIVTFSNGVTGTVIAATDTTLTVTGLSGLTRGTLTATVTTNGLVSAGPFQVATIVPVRDIAIIGMQSDGSQEFSWVALNDLPAGDQIYFTDSGYHDSIGRFDAANTTEFLVRYTVPAGGLCAGVVQRVISGSEGPDYEYILGTELGSDSATFYIDPSGDQIHAFRSTDDPADGASFATTNLEPLFAVNGASTSWTNVTVTTDDNQTNLHPAFRNGEDAVAVGFGPTAEEEYDNVYYSGPTTGTPGQLLDWISTPGNWTGTNSTPPNDSNNGVAAFNVVGRSVPEIAVFEGPDTTGPERTDNIGSADFGNVDIELTSVTRTFTIQNTCTLGLTGIGVSSTNAAEFAVDASSTASSLAYGETTSFTVTFATSVAGVKTGVIEITSNDADESVFEIPMTGTAVIPPPTVVENTDYLPQNATGLTITGTTFDGVTPGNNTVAFSPSGTGTVTVSTTTSLTVTGISGLSGGVLSAVVTTNGQSSAAPVQVATVLAPPTVTTTTTNITPTTTTIIITGTNFDDINLSNNLVTLSGGVTGTVTAATATTLTISGLTGLTDGPVTVSVTTNGQTSGDPVQIATVLLDPTVTSSTAFLGINASTMVISGSNFDGLIPGNNVVVFSPAGSGVVTEATSTSLTVTGITGLELGPLEAVVTTNGQSSGSAVRVATVVTPPVITRVADFGSGRGIGSDTSQAIVNGNPAVTYHITEETSLNYARNSEPDGSGEWEIVVIDYEGNVGMESSLAVIDGHPAVSYYDSSNADLKYVRALDPDGSSWGDPVTIDSAGSVGQYTTLLEVNGHPAISYYDGSNRDLKYVRALNTRGTVWGIPITLDSTNQVGSFATMAIVDGHPAISYYDATLGDLKYVRATDPNGTLATDWGTPVVVDSTGNVGEHTSLAVVAGHPAIAYEDGTNSDTKYVRAADATGSAWNSPLTVDTTASPNSGSLVVVNGHPAIGYNPGGSMVRYVRAADPIGSSWNPIVNVNSSRGSGDDGSMIVIDGRPAFATNSNYQVGIYLFHAADADGTTWAPPAPIGTGDQGGWAGNYASAAIVNGHPAICYRDTFNDDLKYVRANDPRGLTWGPTITVVTTDDVGGHASMAVVNGHPAISYYNATDDDLEFVRADDPDGNTWGLVKKVDTSGNVGFDTSLAVVNGNPAIAYYDFTNGHIKYARSSNQDGTTWSSGGLEIVDSTGGSSPSLTVVNGRPAISYRNSGLKFVRASNSSGSSWGSPVTVDASGTNPSLTIVDGLPAIAYEANSNLGLKFARATNSSGSAWGAPVTLDSTGTVGDYASLAVIGGRPAISYYDSTNDDLKYIQASDPAGTSWEAPVVFDEFGNTGRHTTLLDINGGPGIAYETNTEMNAMWATYGDIPAAPMVIPSTVALVPNDASLVIHGSGFDAQVPGNNTVSFGPAGSGTVTDATETTLTVTGITGLLEGALTAVVSANGQDSGAPVQVATVVTAPLITSPTSTGVGRNEATLGGDVLSQGGAPVTERGVVLAITSENADPQIGGADVTKIPGSGATGAFTVLADSLTPSSDYTFKAYATNALGTRYTDPGTFSTTNQAPTFGGYIIGVGYEATIPISLAKVLTGAVDPEGDALTITAIGASANGATLLVESSTISYTAPTGFSGVDTFPVTVTDTYGASVVGTITVNVADSPTTGGQGLNPPRMNITGGNGEPMNVELEFKGIPGRSYELQRSTDMENWATISTIVAGANGSIDFTDESPPPSSAFYRLRRP